MTPRSPRSTLFPYTTLFRSRIELAPQRRRRRAGSRVGPGEHARRRATALVDAEHAVPERRERDHRDLADATSGARERLVDRARGRAKALVGVEGRFAVDRGPHRAIAVRDRARDRAPGDVEEERAQPGGADV